MGNTVSQFRDLLTASVPGRASSLTTSQLSVRNQMTLSALACTTWCYLGYHYLPLRLPTMPGVAERLAYAIQWQLPAVTFMAVTVMEVAGRRWRDATAVDPTFNDSDEKQAL